MKPTLEQIKTDESVWPEGASHYIGGQFTKWVGCTEYAWQHNKSGWLQATPSWSLEKYQDKFTTIIPRPVKLFIPVVGEWCISPSGSKIFYIGMDEKARHVFSLKNGGITVYDSMDGFKPIKTERDVLLEIIKSTGNMSCSVLADDILNAGFTLEKGK